MDCLVECCAGLDVHQKTIVACVLKGQLNRTRPEKAIETFSTTKTGILALADWLLSYGVTTVSMESTGVYWRPIWTVLQSHFECILANPRLIKNVPGKKTDIKDAEWIAKLTRIGLVPASFVPPIAIQELRELTRYRKHLTEDLNRMKNRGHAVLQNAGIKLTSMMKDIYGKSGRNLLYLLLSGEEITEEIVRPLVYTTLKGKIPALLEAMDGFLTSHYREMLRFHLDQIAFLEQQIAQVEQTIKERLIPFEEELNRLDEIPGIDWKTAAIVIAEIGVNMSVFPTANHLASWAGLSPGNNESAGKYRSTRVGKGNAYLKKVLVQGAIAVRGGKENRLKNHFWRLCKNRGHKKAAVATAHLMLKICYALLRDKSHYKEFEKEVLRKKEFSLQPA